MKKLILASGNAGSLREIQAIPGRPGCGFQRREEMPAFQHAPVKDPTTRKPRLSMPVFRARQADES
jgi:hypothetical protein